MRSGEIGMPTGNGNNGHKTLATGLRFEKGRLVVEFSDQREVSVPLNLYPTLRHARRAQRADWRLIGPGRAFHWPSLDLDLSVAGIINGLPEIVPMPPRLPKRKRSLQAS
jgi:hypothetical protein